MNTLRETAETFALNQWLSDYPADMPYQEILDQLHSGSYEDDFDIMPWQLIENYSGNQIAEMIDDTRRAFERHAADLLAAA
jgi:hypothetical protein